MFGKRRKVIRPLNIAVLLVGEWVPASLVQVLPDSHSIEWESSDFVGFAPEGMWKLL